MTHDSIWKLGALSIVVWTMVFLGFSTWRGDDAPEQPDPATTTPAGTVPPPAPAWALAVRDRETGEALDCASVGLARKPDGAETIERIVFDADDQGSATLTGIRPGTYLVNVSQCAEYARSLSAMRFEVGQPPRHIDPDSCLGSEGQDGVSG